MTPALILVIAGFAAGVLASALFAGLETGTYVLNKARLELRIAHGDRRARRLGRALSRPQDMLAALLIATNASHYWVTALAVLMFTQSGVGKPQLYTTMIVTPLLFVLGEMVPKNLFRVAGETLTYRLGFVVAALMGVCRWTGLSALVAAISRAVLWLMPGRPETSTAALEPRQRLHSFLSEGHAHGVLSEYQSRMAHRVVAMPLTTIREVMVPRANVVSIPVDCTRERFIETLSGHNFSRLAVWRDTPDNVIGIVNVYDVLYDDDSNAAPATHMAEPLKLAERDNVSGALLTLQRAHRSIGVVTDEKDRFVGIVTLKDLVEEIVGELEAW